MLAGHYGAAFLAKRIVPAAPLWALALGVQLVDVLWTVFVLLGIEHLRIDPDLPSNPLVLYDMPYTHSLLGTLVWAGLAFAAARRWLGDRRVAAAVAAAVASHWLLDVAVHRPDMTLFGGEPKLGLAVWNHPAAALTLEIGLLVGTAWLCARTPGSSPRLRRGIFALVGALVAVQLLTTFAPPPLGPAGVAATGLALFLGVALAASRIERGAARPWRDPGMR